MKRDFSLRFDKFFIALIFLGFHRQRFQVFRNFRSTHFKRHFFLSYFCGQRLETLFCGSFQEIMLLWRALTCTKCLGAFTGTSFQTECFFHFRPERSFRHTFNDACWYFNSDTVLHCFGCFCFVHMAIFTECFDERLMFSGFGNSGYFLWDLIALEINSFGRIIFFTVCLEKLITNFRDCFIQSMEYSSGSKKFSHKKEKTLIISSIFFKSGRSFIERGKSAKSDTSLDKRFGDHRDQFCAGNGIEQNCSFSATGNQSTGQENKSYSFLELMFLAQSERFTARGSGENLMRFLRHIELRDLRTGGLRIFLELRYFGVV